MNTEQALQVAHIVKDAEAHRNGDYRAYERFKQRVADMGLRADEYERVIRQVAKRLNV